ncbi:MAG TPA: tripartite tricarboxylate transporter TctB family protein [Hyphomicrobiaceae bacterium]|nr:tripartite tricarboxylate transporter TctB family protein [Hyphomicrobiaceae bacterium]
MRRAELIFAVILGAFSIYLMYMAQLPPLQIGWVPEKGPGSGATPFWLSFGMLICAVWIFWRGWRGITPQGRSTEPFMDAYTLRIVSVTVGSIFMMLLATHYIGAYAAMFLFLIFYVGIFGKIPWPTTIAVSLAIPIGIFFLFESGMKILLPKGLSEPLFIPLYKMFVY